MIDLVNKAMLNLFHALACCWVFVSLFLSHGSESIILKNHVPHALLPPTPRYCALDPPIDGLNPFRTLPYERMLLFRSGFDRLGWRKMLRCIEKVRHDRVRLPRAESRSKIRITRIARGVGSRLYARRLFVIEKSCKHHERLISQRCRSLLSQLLDLARSNPICVTWYARNKSNRTFASIPRLSDQQSLSLFFAFNWKINPLNSINPLDLLHHTVTIIRTWSSRWCLLLTHLKHLNS